MPRSARRLQSDALTCKGAQAWSSLAAGPSLAAAAAPAPAPALLPKRCPVAGHRASPLAAACQVSVSLAAEVPRRPGGGSWPGRARTTVGRWAPQGAAAAAEWCPAGPSRRGRGRNLRSRCSLRRQLRRRRTHRRVAHRPRSCRKRRREGRRGHKDRLRSCARPAGRKGSKLAPFPPAAYPRHPTEGCRVGHLRSSPAAARRVGGKSTSEAARHSATAS
mmetsp:Transcript_103877/g.252186  ORF Transcript_103877/g.252186 Transcript_103877/m.252186 type:complete len:219 (+) Transcript_103877:91-747(+)